MPTESFEQTVILSILAAMVVLFVWGRWRHDVVALGALMACVLAGLVPAENAFAGFGHPAVITVACVLVLSRGLQNSGAVDLMARAVLPSGGGRAVSMLALLGLGAALSAFMNNVGAMALLMPVAVHLARRLDLGPGQVLMPLAFATMLGGMTTLVGTPPNLIVAGFREGAGRGAFEMFDFAPVGVAVALAGIAFVVVFGWWLVPLRRAAAEDGFDTAAYMTEVRVPERSGAVGKTLRGLETAMGDNAPHVIALVRSGVRMHAPHGGRVLRAEDVLVLEGDAETLAEALAAVDLKLEESGPSGDGAGPGDEDTDKADDSTDPAAGAGQGADGAEATAPGDTRGGAARDDDIILRELAVLPGSLLVGRSSTDLRLRTRYGLNLLAVSREGKRPRSRLRALKLRVGDVLMMQGPAETLTDFASETGCVPLAERALRLPERRMAMIATAIMAAAVGIAAFGLLPVAAAFALGVLASMLLRTVPPRSVYTAIDWPVVVLLAALLPVAGAMETTGTAEMIATRLVSDLAFGQPVAALAVVLVVTMLLSGVINNAATAAVMCPVALGIAAALGASPDAFLMAVAIGASCAFITPIGHQNATLILGPGGFRFGDYWRLGLPLEVLVLVVSLPLLLIVWPL